MDENGEEMLDWDRFDGKNIEIGQEGVKKIEPPKPNVEEKEQSEI